MSKGYECRFQVQGKGNTPVRQMPREDRFRYTVEGTRLIEDTGRRVLYSFAKMNTGLDQLLASLTVIEYACETPGL